MTDKKIITICSSVSFYEQVIEIEKQLIRLNFTVIIPKTAREMEQTGNFNVEQHKTWYKNKADYAIKTKRMTDHFQEVIKSDAILVLNYKKNTIEGYIGGNTLMEMTIAFHYKKPIFIFDEISENLPIKEEIYGINPIFLQKKISHIKRYL